MAAVGCGDAASLRRLIDRYDRLVRYVAFRVGRRRANLDPQWVDTVASDAWLGLVKRLQRSPDQEVVGSITALITRITRNRAVSALRSDLAGTSRSLLESDAAPKNEERLDEGEPAEDPAELAERIDLLGKLRDCLSDLEEPDQVLASQLDAVTMKRWRKAALALGISESTLRTRWKRVENTLRGCLERKSGKSFAPGGDSGD